MKSPTGVPTFAKVETLPDPSSGEHHRTAYRPPGLAALPSVLPESLPAQSGETVTVTRVITYVYDPLNRLTSADYSTAEAFKYVYDAVGNRTAMTTTTPLSGTVVTTYEYDTANRLTARAGGRRGAGKAARAAGGLSEKGQDNDYQQRQTQPFPDMDGNWHWDDLHSRGANSATNKSTG